MTGEFYKKEATMEKLTTAECKEVISLLTEYAQTKMLCIGQREKDLIRRFCAESSKKGNK